MRILIHGAAGSGKTWLAQALHGALAADHPQVQVMEADLSPGPGLPPPPACDHSSSNDSIVLLMGLDLPSPGPNRLPAQEVQDRQIRSALAQAGVAFHVVYGSGQQRLAQALTALGKPPVATNSVANYSYSTRAKDQFDGEKPVELRPAAAAWHWQCDRCSDPACEHRLFTGLAASEPADGSTGVAAARPAG